MPAAEPGPHYKCVWERGRETEGINNHRREGLHFLLYSDQDPATHFSSFHSQGDQDRHFQPRVSDGPERRMSCPRSWLVAQLDFYPAFCLLNVCTIDDA